MIDELERIWKEAVLPRHYLEGLTEVTKKPNIAVFYGLTTVSMVMLTDVSEEPDASVIIVEE
jgi:hypothetical protein